MNDFNDFDQILELKLRHLLDPVVARRPPVRGARQKPQQPIRIVERGGVELAVEAIHVVEPVVVSLPVAAARQL